MGKKKDVSAEHRTEIMQALLASLKNNRPSQGLINEVAARYSICRKTVSRIWKIAKDQRTEGEIIDVKSKSKGRVRHLKHSIDFAKIEAIPVENRGTIQAMSNALGIPRSTVARFTKFLLRPHTNHIKPLLKAPNMLSRLHYSLQAINYDAGVNALKFKPMETTIHIDEKWFMLTRKSCRYYLTPMEAEPHRVIQSKKFIPKVMFMCAASRPVYDAEGTLLFDGKIGIWPLVEEVTAQRNSIRRPRGTRELKPIQSITRQVIKDCLIKEIIPAIKQKWPACLSKNISIQQDNARPHIKDTDAEFAEIANSDGFHIKLVNQPPNSPDCNANDLGFFCAIQALQQRMKCRNADELILAVKHSFNMLDPMTLNKVFLSLQCVILEIMKVKGGNNFKQPHMKKDSLIRHGLLPTNLDVPEFLVRECIDYLISEESTAGVEELMEKMGINVPQNGGEIPDLNL